ncbi:putative phosphatidylinositol transporter [Pyronema omphalodes]|nr:putative phosphatidylinositol transporter [Pyronema omphalodes]
MAVDSKYDVFTYPTTNPESGAGHPGHTTPEQDELVAQLRKELEADGFTERLDTLTLLRFLRARKFDVALAKKMYTDCEAWRKEFKVDDLVRDFTFVEKPQVFEYYPQYYHKIDKDGRPVYIEKLGKINLNTIKTITTEERLIQNLVVEYERLANPRLPACSRKAGKLLETSCTIMDIGGVGIQSMYSATEFLKKVSAISQNYYPERLGKLYIINAPWTFSTIWNGIKVFLDPVTVSKIKILKGPSEYEAVLKEQIPAENLPKEFGGSCECPGGCQLADAGPWNDPQYMEPAVPAATTSAAPAEVTENQI